MSNQHCAAATGHGATENDVYGSRKLVLIMGAGAGIGHACARAFAGRGSELILSDVDQPRLNAAARELGGMARFCDAMSETSVAIFTADLIHNGLVPDIVVNAAGNGYIRTLGMMWLSHELLPAMRKAGGRRLMINIAPDRSKPMICGRLPYGTTPAAFYSLSDALAARTRGSGIQVITVAPPRSDDETIPAGSAVHSTLLVTADVQRIVDAALQPGWRNAAAANRG